MQKIILTLGALALLGSVLLINDQPLDHTLNYKSQFEAFKTKYRKSYSPTEEAYRLLVYASNVIFAKQYNAKKGQDVFGETIFFDLTDEEFKQTYLTLQQDQVNTDKKITLPFDPRKDSVDWVSQGYVTNVKDQGNCGSCWAFGATGVLEGFFKRTEGQLYHLSEKQLLDCTKDFNFGCSGGMTSRAMNYVKANGITDEDKYPYKPQKDNCAIKEGAHKINGHTSLEATEQGLIGGLQLQPISVGVDATNWKYYDFNTQKIFSDCENALNHAVLAVGYDDQSWKIKNSWSAAWGDQGYIYLARGNTCGVLLTAIIPY